LKVWQQVKGFQFSRTQLAAVMRPIEDGHRIATVLGVAGAGKSTLLRRLFGLRGGEGRTVLTADGVRVIDSLQSRYRLGPLLGRVPYPLWRWVVHVLHLARIAAALRGGPVVVHECGTRRSVRVLLALTTVASPLPQHTVVWSLPP
jgi:energy-coupling factor transporter ATP-binding protein EcfA2